MTRLRCAAILAAAALLGASPAIAQDAGPQVLSERYDTQGESLREVFSPVVEAARGSVVRLRLDGRPVALGTVVGPGGLVLTKASEIRPVVEVEKATLTAELPGGAIVAATLVAEDRRQDLALLRVKGDGLSPVNWVGGGGGGGGGTPLGSWVVIPGVERLPVAVGIVSSVPRPVQGVRLGISLGDTRRGVMIGDVIEGMGAAEAGLRPGDVIVKVGPAEIEVAQDVLDAVQQVNAGDVLAVVIERDGKARSFNVEMRLRPDDPRSRADRMNTMGNDRSRRRDGFASVFQHDAEIDPAECGGPVLDLDGRCLGINIARAGRIEAFALPAVAVQEVLRDLMPDAPAGSTVPLPAVEAGASGE